LLKINNTDDEEQQIDRRPLLQKAMITDVRFEGEGAHPTDVALASL
jgi:hypothetical protein